LDLLQKAQDVIKFQSTHPETQANFPYDAYFQNYGFFYGMNPYANSYMGMMGGAPYGSYRGSYKNQYYNNNTYYDQMFIRKAQDEANEVEPQRGEYQSRYDRRKDKYSKKPYFPKNQRGTQSDSKQMSVEEIKRRTRVNSENFPPLMSEEKPLNNPEEKEEVVEEIVETTSKDRRKYHKDDFVKLFKQIGSHVKPNERLFKFNEAEVPVLNLTAKPNLEFIESSTKKHSETISRKQKEEIKEKS